MKGFFYIILCITYLMKLEGSFAAESSPPTFEADKREVQRILRNLDDLSLTPSQQLENYLDDAVLLAPDAKEVRGSDALLSHLEEFSANDGLSINHKIVELNSFADVVVVQGRVEGIYTSNENESFPFETKNIILFRRDHAGILKIWKVIYNGALLN